ncbi:hypothetical protein GGR62_003670 [Xanthomonas campestris]|nr:hypothetical protein [Xanthomonas sp. 3075]
MLEHSVRLDHGQGSAAFVILIWESFQLPFVGERPDGDAALRRGVGKHSVAVS